jgi:nicotinamidase-related amidase
MLSFQGREIPDTLAEIVRPERTVVIMHDIQNDNTGPDGAFAKAGRRIDVSTIVGPIARFLAVARQHRVKVLYTQYTNLPNFATFTEPRIRENYAILSDPVKRDTLVSSIEGTWGCQTIDQLKPRPGELIINKYRVDAFIGTPLEYLLRLHGLKTIIHTGIATEVGILPTAWHALNLGFFVVVPEDCVGPMQPEYHAEAMAFLRRLAIVTKASEIESAWKGTSG